MSADNSCSICDDADDKENPILKCKVCKIRVHLYCNGAEEQVENWICSPCRTGKTKFATCRLCLYKGGAMKETLCNGWVHIICALFTDGVTFTNVTTMEPVDISNVSKNKRNKLCMFCYKSQGYCCLCSNSKCNERLHISCAQKEKCLKEIESETDGTIKFRAYCKNHKPKPANSGRRVSSGSVKDILIKKRQKRLVESGAKTNADWIFNSLHTSAEKTDNTVDRSNENNEELVLGASHTFIYSNKRLSESGANIEENPKKRDVLSCVDCIDGVDSPRKKRKKNNKKDKANKRGMQNIESCVNDFNAVQNPSTSNINESNKTPNAYETDTVINDENNLNAEENKENEVIVDDLNTVQNPSTSNINEPNKTPNAYETDIVIIDENNLNAEENKENEVIDKHACNKDIAIKKLKEKNKTLKADLYTVRQLNYQLQQGLINRLFVKPHDDLNVNELPESILVKVPEPKLTENGDKVVFANGQKMEKVKADFLKTISGDHTQDRAYVNKFFSLVYSEKYLLKLATKAQIREKFLQELRETKRCANIKAMYDFRVVSNAGGNVAKRLEMFKLAFRTKVNNWWSSNAAKIPNPHF